MTYTAVLIGGPAHLRTEQVERPSHQMMVAGHARFVHGGYVGGTEQWTTHHYAQIAQGLRDQRLLIYEYTGDA